MARKKKDGIEEIIDEKDEKTFSLDEGFQILGVAKHSQFYFQKRYSNERKSLEDWKLLFEQQ